jgi:ABC-type spermidine/putrescine transport system permease subunit II
VVTVREVLDLMVVVMVAELVVMVVRQVALPVVREGMVPALVLADTLVIESFVCSLLGDRCC